MTGDGIVTDRELTMAVVGCGCAAILCTADGER